MTLKRLSKTGEPTLTGYKFMKLRSVFKGTLFLIISGVFGFGIVAALLANRNFKLVYYGPKNKIAIRTDSEPSTPYPMLSDNEVRNVILFISDGLGISQLAATRIHYKGPDGRLHIERMPVTGLVTPHSIDDIIPDSGSTATAIATGVKTRNKMLSVDASGASRTTILEAARDAGFSTGIITSTEITDATPAAFASHVLHRYDDASKIPMQFIEAKVNVLFGQGGTFYPSKRGDELDPIAAAKNAGYQFVDTKKELAEASGDFVLGLFDDIMQPELGREIETSTETPSIAELTEKAIGLLSRNEKGFFLMVEEEATDSGSHVNREDYVVYYLKELDEAVKVAIEFALEDEHTLVLATADHETGGFNIIRGPFEDGYMEFIWNTYDHTGQPVPLFAFGPHAVRFTGLKDNTELPKIMAELLGLNAFL